MRNDQPRYTGPINVAYRAGIEDSIKCIKQRKAHYELYREDGAIKTHPATFAVLDEMLVFLGAMLERTQDKETA
jgi:hypothetical protein